MIWLSTAFIAMIVYHTTSIHCVIGWNRLSTPPNGGIICNNLSISLNIIILFIWNYFSYSNHISIVDVFSVFFFNWKILVIYNLRHEQTKTKKIFFLWNFFRIFFYIISNRELVEFIQKFQVKGTLSFPKFTTFRSNFFNFLLVKILIFI